jgi:hypothetical protein
MQSFKPRAPHENNIPFLGIHPFDTDDFYQWDKGLDLANMICPVFPY